MKFASEHEAPPGVRDKREKIAQLRQRKNERKLHSGLKAVNIYQFRWKVVHKYSYSNNQNQII